VQEDDFGVVTKKVREAVAETAKRNPKVVFLADSRTHIRLYRNVMIKPNQFEVVGHDTPLPGETVPLEALLTAMAKLRKTVGAAIFATRGAEGIIVSDPEITNVRGVRVEGQIDSTGAGDATAAGITLAMAAGANHAEAALVGNLVASITIQQLATTGVAKPEELGARLEAWREARHARFPNDEC
jgi:bifunctional ADP-heptose synthase (sugar kinase/adenylyltransferase)